MNTFAEIITEIKKYQTIIIHRHLHPDPDAIGTQSGLAFSLRAAYPDKKILMTGSEVGDLDFIATMDEVSDADYQEALVIVVDCANQPRVSDQRFHDGQKLIKIDHHPNVDPYGDLQYVDDQASSTSEIIFELIASSNGELVLNAAVAASLYAGIVGDTGRFLFNSTSSRTFAIASELVGTGIDHTAISQNIQEVTLAQAKLQNMALDTLELDPSGAAMIMITAADLAKYHINFEQAKAAVSTPGRLKEVMTWVTFTEKPDGTYRVSYRSKGPVINTLAQKHDGGGHDLASGANAQDLKEVQEIFQELIAVTKKYKGEK